MKSAQSGKGKFESLCHVKVDITGAPYTSNLRESGVMGYMRRYNVILLVGHTELKAQVSWNDSETVCGISLYPTPTPSDLISTCTNLQGEEIRFVATHSEFVLPRLNPTFRSDAMVVYDDPPYPVDKQASVSETEQALALGSAQSPAELPGESQAESQAESPEVVHN